MPDGSPSQPHVNRVRHTASPPGASPARARIRLGRIAGIEIGLDYSWFIIFGLILLSMGAGQLPAALPGVDRTIIERGAQRLGMELTELITDTIMGMRDVAEEIGLKGTCL